VTHPRVDQLRFARSEWLRGLAGLSDADAVIRLDPMNSISWMVGHMAWHERECWFRRARGLRVEPGLDAFATGQPASVPSLATVQGAWDRVIADADPFLDALTTTDLEQRPEHDPRPNPPIVGSQIQYVTYHYWAHIGEVSAVRQILGHQGLAEYVGDFPPEAEYRPEG
jgi:uncharacterized damage-inducible protein DinB